MTRFVVGDGRIGLQRGAFAFAKVGPRRSAMETMRLLDHVCTQRRTLTDRRWLHCLANQRNSRNRASSRTWSPDNVAVIRGGCAAVCISYKCRIDKGFATNSRMHWSRVPSSRR